MKPETLHITSVPHDALVQSTLGIPQARTLGYVFRALEISTLASTRIAPRLDFFGGDLCEEIHRSLCY